MSGDFHALNGAVIILYLRINGIARNAIAPIIPIKATIHKEGTTPTADIEADMEKGGNCPRELFRRSAPAETLAVTFAAEQLQWQCSADNAR